MAKCLGELPDMELSQVGTSGADGEVELEVEVDVLVVVDAAAAC